MLRQFLRAVQKPTFFNQPRFFFAEDHSKAIEKQPQQQKKETKKDIQYYKDGQLVNKTSLVLKKQEDIEGYVLNTLRAYFRTTNKQGLNLESVLNDHGLDSLDQIELAMQVEEDLGYQISAETLPVLQKVKHFVNYINHVEQFKAETQRAPLS